jgi:spore coat protein CotH
MPTRSNALAVIIALGAWAGCDPGLASAQTSTDLFDPSLVHEIRLFVNSRDLRQLHERFEDNAFYPADLLWRDVRVRNVGIRSRGFGSRNPIKLGLEIDFDRYTTDQRFLGLRSLVLDNFWQDPAMVREYLAMGFLNRMGEPAPRESFCRLYINEVYQGLYAAVEPVDEAFVARTLQEHEGFLFEYRWSYPFFGEDLGDDLAAYALLFEARTNERDADSTLWGPVQELWRAVNEPDPVVWRDRVEALVDLRQFVTQAAIENYLAENDGLLGYAGFDNFYLYRSAGGTRHRFFPWDKDGAFLQADFEPLRGAAENVLMRRALDHADLRALYFDVLEACARVDGAEAWLATQTDAIAAIIRDSAYADPLKPVDNDAFDQAIDFIRAFARTRSGFMLNAVSRVR